MKRVKVFLVAIAFGLLLFGCSSQKEAEVTSEEKVIPVKTMKAYPKSILVTLDYLGFVTSKEIKNYSFKMSGEIAKVHVEKGQQVQKGTPLVELDTNDLRLAVEAAKSQLDAAQAQYNKATKGATQEEINQVKMNVQKAQEAYNHIEDTYQKLKTLFESGAVSKQELEKAELELKLSKINLKQAKEVETQLLNGVRQEDKEVLLSQVKQAQINYAQQIRLLNDATIKADTDGYVVDVLLEEGEATAAGYPVVVLKGQQQVVNVGLSQEDVNKVHVGTIAEIKSNDIQVEGEILNIAQTPDEKSMTYNAEIALKESMLPMGALVEVFLFVGEQQGFSVPINSVMHDGKDYIFVVENNRVIRKDIKILSLEQENAVIEGIREGEKVVVEGVKQVKDGDKAIIIQ